MLPLEPLVAASTERTPASAGGARRLARASEGVAYVEFLIAFFPILILFAGLFQLQLVFLTRLFVSRAAFAAARAAAVYIPQPDEQGHVTHHISDAARDAVSDAVLLATAPVLLRGWLAEPPYVTFPDSAGPRSDSERTRFEDGANMVRVRLISSYVCHVPPTDLLMCGGSAEGRRVIPITAEAAFPYQRADYQYDVEQP